MPALAATCSLLTMPKIPSSIGTIYMLDYVGNYLVPTYFFIFVLILNVSNEKK